MSRRFNIGLDNAAKIDKLEVVWANGQTKVFPVEKIDTQIILEQNKSGVQNK